MDYCALQGFVGLAWCGELHWRLCVEVAAIGGYPRRVMMQWLDRDLTPEKEATTYTNFYNLIIKNIWRDAQKLTTDPWMVILMGLLKLKCS